MKKITVSILTTLLMLSMVFSSSVFAANEETSAWDSFLGLFSAKTSTTAVGVEYRGHIQNKGNFPLDPTQWVQGPNRLGTVGEALRLEGFWIQLTNKPADVNIKYQVHVQNEGWMNPVMNGAFAGTEGKSQRIEAIKIWLVDAAGNPVSGYSVEYRGHVENVGDVPAVAGTWYKDGDQLGTVGASQRLEALEVKIVATTPQSDLTAYNAAVAEAAALTEADYTVASWAALETALEENVVTGANTQAEVDAATAAINDAIDALVMVPKVTDVKAVNGTVETAITTPVKVTSNIQIAFSKDLDVATVVSANIYLKQDGVKQLATVTYDSAKKAATIDTASYLETGKTYELTVENVKDTTGAAVNKYTTTFETSTNAVVTSAKYDASAGAVGGTDLTAYDTDLAGGNVNDAAETIALTFNAEMDWNTITTTNVKLYDVTDSKYIVVTPLKVTDTNVPSLGDFLKLTPATMTATHQYTLTLKQGIADLAGNTLGEDYTATFYYNGTAPAYGTITAGDDSTSPYTNIYNKITAGSGKSAFRWQAQVTQDLNAATVNGTNVTMKETVSGNAVAVSVSYESGSRHIVIVPSADLKELTEYTVTIQNVKGTAGLNLPDAKDATAYKFTTGDFTNPTIVSTKPVNATEGVVISDPIVVNFSEKMSEGSLTLGANIKLLDASNSDAAFAPFTSWLKQLSEDGKTLTLTPTAGNELLPNRTYKLVLEKDVLADVSTNANKVLTKTTIAFTTANTATVTFKDARQGGFATTNTAITNDATNVTYNGGDINATYTGALKTNTAAYKLYELVKIERYVAETGNWVTETTAAAAAADTFGIALANANKTIVLDCPTTRTDDTNTAIDESSATYNNNLVNDTKYRITLPATIKDVNDNGVQAQTLTFVVGAKPTVNATTSYPQQYRTAVDDQTPYVIAVLSDAESNLSLSTLNSSTVKFVKKADSSAAPYTLAYVNNKKLSSKTVAVNETVNSASFDIDGADAAEVKVGSIITIAGQAQAFVVTAVNSPEITVDRTVSVTDNDVITLQQGVVYKLNDGAKLESKTEYQVQVTGVQDIAGNVVSDTNYTFESETVIGNLAVVSATVSEGTTGVATGQKVQLVFNEPVTNVTDNQIFVNVAGLGNAVTTRVAFQKADGTVVTGTYDFSSDNKTLTFLPNGYLTPGTVYNVVIDATTASATGPLTESYTFSFRTEDTSSAAISSAVYYDTNGDDVIGLGDVVRLTFNTQSLVGTGINAANDFTVTGPGTTLGAATVSALTTNNYVDITLAADSVVTPNLSTIKVVTGNGATFTTDAVTIAR